MSDTPAPTGSNALLFIFITVLLSMIGIGIVIPVMPTLIEDLTGLGASEASKYNGYLLTVYALMQFIMSPILGGLSDRFGRRPVLLASLAMGSLDYLLMAIAPSLAWLFLGRAVAGMTAAVFSTANAAIADISPPEKRAARFGLLGAAFGLGFIFGPIIGGALGEIGPRYPFYLASAVLAANFVFGFFAFPESLSSDNRRAFDIKRANPVGSLLQVSKYPTVIGILLAYFMVQLAHHALPAIWAFFTTEKFAWSSGDVGVSLAYVGVTAAFVQGYLIRKVMPKLGERRAVTLGGIAMVASFIGYAFLVPTGSFVYIWITIGAIGGFIMPGMQGLMSKAAPSDAQGELQGAISSVMSISMVSSPLFMSQVFSAFTAREGLPYFPGAPFALAAVLLACALIPFWIATRQLNRQPSEKH